MKTAFHHIAYQGLDVCNALSWDQLRRAIELTGTRPGASTLDLGCAYARTSILMATELGFTVTAVDADGRMAQGARQQISQAGLEQQVRFRQGLSYEVLRNHPPFDLILALGTTQPVGPGIREPEIVFSRLAEQLVPGGHLIWGDLTWISEPSAPLRQLVEVSGYYVSHQAWQEAAQDAGLGIRLARLSDSGEWADYRQTMEASVRDWLDTHPDHPDASAIAAADHRIRLMFDFGAESLGFGLYVFQKPANSKTPSADSTEGARGELIDPA